MKTLKRLLILLLVLFLLLGFAHLTRAQDTIFYDWKISSQTPSYSYNSKGVFEYNGKVVDTSKAMCEAFARINGVRDTTISIH